MSYVSHSYKDAVNAPVDSWACAPGSKHGPFTDTLPANLEGSPDYCGGCVSYVKQVCPSLPATLAWKKGALVKKNHRVASGTVIATFDSSGRFNGHAAIYVSQGSAGVLVYDQYAHPPKPIGPRTLRWGHPIDVNNGEKFYVVE
jgi:hypothetical protein